LEELVATLNSRAARATAELDASQRLIHQLQELREHDLRKSREKEEEIDMLRSEIERLQDEITRLTEVVEDGLRERRMTREMDELRSREDSDRSSEGAEELMRRQLSAVEEEEEEHDQDGHPHSMYQDGHDGYDTELDEDGDGVHIEVQDATLEYTRPDIHPPDFRPESPMGSGSVSSLTRSASAMSMRSNQSGNNSRMDDRPRPSSRGASPRFGHGFMPVDRRPQSRMSNKGRGGIDDDASSTSSVGRVIPPNSRRFISVSF